MSSLMDKFKKSKAATASTTISTSTSTTPATAKVKATATKRPSLAAGLRQSRLAKASTPVSKHQSSASRAATLAVSSQKKEEKVTEMKKEVEIPQTILDRPANLPPELNADEFMVTLASTYEALVNDEPMLPTLLQQIARNLQQYEELHYLLNADQIGLLFKGLTRVKNVQLKTVKQRNTQKQLTSQVEKEGGLDLEF